MEDIKYKDLITTLNILRQIAEDKEITDSDKLYLLCEVDKKVKDFEKTVVRRTDPQIGGYNNLLKNNEN